VRYPPSYTCLKKRSDVYTITSFLGINLYLTWIALCFHHKDQKQTHTHTQTNKQKTHTHKHAHTRARAHTQTQKSTLFFGDKNLKHETSQRAILWELRYSMQSKGWMDMHAEANNCYSVSQCT
jgi:hypothetical protein